MPSIIKNTLILRKKVGTMYNETSSVNIQVFQCIWGTVAVSWFTVWQLSYYYRIGYVAASSIHVALLYYYVLITVPRRLQATKLGRLTITWKF